MSVEPMNLLVIMSDEHNREALGCYGHPVVQTPNLDQLAKEGVRFSNAYTNCPICVPARASMATGRYPHQIGAWDNAAPYTGTVPSWGHRLTEQGHPVVTIGKLHYRDDSDDTGFPDKRLAMHVLEGIGDIYSLIREDMAPRPSAREKLLAAGPGESEYNRYDLAIRTEAQRFLREEARAESKPWAAFVSFVAPHFPLTVPEKYLNLYSPDQVIFPKQYSLDERPRHPVLEKMRHAFSISDEFDELTVRKAVAAYYGLCTFLDDQVGQLLATLRETGLDRTTRIVYTTDHGDSIGDHGLWWKHTMYEGSVGVPFIISGPDVPHGKVVNTHISLVDCFPTFVEGVGAHLNTEDQDMPGTSLWPMVFEGERPQRTVFSEYHAAGAVTAMFMIRENRYKYVHYVNYPPQLFDLAVDPHELFDLSSDDKYQDILRECEAALRAIVDPEEVDRQAKKDQQQRLQQHGGAEEVLKQGYRVVYSPPPTQFTRQPT